MQADQMRREEVHSAHPTVDHPDHYGGEDNPYEAIKVIEAWKLGFCLGNAVKYIARTGKKLGAAEAEDIRKAIWYLTREAERIEAEAAKKKLRLDDL